MELDGLITLFQVKRNFWMALAEKTTDESKKSVMLAYAAAYQDVMSELKRICLQVD